MKTIHRNKKTIAIFTLLLTGVWVWTATAGTLNPPTAPGSTMKTLDEVQPRIAVNDENTPGDASSVYKITEPGSYYLTDNLYANGKHGVLIEADDVTLDLMGFRIWASYETANPPANTAFDGIYIHDSGRNIEIRNGTINSTHEVGTGRFRNGIYSPFQPFTSYYSRYLRIYNIRVFRCSDYGIITNGYYATVQDCHAAENGDTGIAASAGIITNCVAYQNNGKGISANGCVVTGCKSLGNYGGCGIYLGDRGVATENSVSNNSEVGIEAGDNCVINRNAIATNSGNGITAGAGSKVHDNTVAGSGAIGIEAGNGCVLVGNTVSSSADNGIEASDGVTLDKNSSFANSQNGIKVAAGCVVTNNTAYQNSASGIYTGLSAVIKNNNAYDNDSSGIYVGGYGSTVVGNAARNNQSYGIYMTAYGLVDQNAAYGNNQSGGSYDNLFTPSGCAVGLNMAP